MTPTPVQKSDGKWYITVCGVQYGPYEDEEAAWEIVEAVLAATDCRTGACD